MTGLNLEHWVLEVGIAFLGAWAVWKSLPTDPEIDWQQFQLALGHAFQGQEPDTGIFSRPLNLVSWSALKVDASLTTSEDLDPQLLAVLGRKLEDTIVVGSEELVADWVRLFELQRLIADWSSDSLLPDLEKVLERRSQRFIFVVQGEDVQRMLVFLHANPAVRDFTGAIVVIEPVVDNAWVQKHFNHTEMDVEANLSIPYFVCESTPTNVFTVASDPSGWKAIEVIDCFPEVLQWMTEKSLLWVVWIAMLLSKRKESV